MDLPELISASTKDYESLALKLAREPHTLDGSKRKLARNRETCALFDTARYTCATSKPPTPRCRSDGVTANTSRFPSLQRSDRSAASEARFSGIKTATSRAQHRVYREVLHPDRRNFRALSFSASYTSRRSSSPTPNV